MAGSLIINGQTIAKIIRNATDLSPCQIEELIAASWKECPSCKYHIDNSDVSPQWLGFPAGVKFAPTDLELLLHLEGKVGRAAHVQIDDFIPTIEADEGICYTHPQNLPGIKMDGSSSHFFHRISNAFVSGGRKRRKISNKNHIDSDEHMRWHKTGQSSPIYDDGVIKGWKKILVLYKGEKGKGHKTNWKMHQYHLGVEKDEKHGEYVVCRVFCQAGSNKIGKSQMYAAEIDPTTPNAYPPQPRRLSGSPFETEQNRDEEEPSSSAVQPMAEAGDHLPRVAGTSRAEVDDAGAGLPPLCNDDIDEMPVPALFSDVDFYTLLRTAPDLFPLADEEQPSSSAVQPETGDHLSRGAGTSRVEVDYEAAGLPPLCDIHEMLLHVDYSGMGPLSGFSDMDYDTSLKTAPALFPLADSFINLGDCLWTQDGNEA